MAYTIQDTPETTARVERDLGQVLQKVREGDPGLRSLVLTGGFARGEGAMLDGRPQNDYDLVAIRGWRRPRVPYAQMRSGLERELGLHIDLAPVRAARLRHVARSIFWYETALRGRVLWGENLLDRVPVRTVERLDRAEGARLLVNRAAGLLLATKETDPHAVRIQAAKGLLAAADVELLAHGSFAPSQRERWPLYEELTGNRRRGAGFDWADWAFRFKVDPAGAPAADAEEAWRAARAAILQAVPLALRHAGLASLESYARRSGMVDRLVYLRRSRSIPGAWRIALHPTGRVRVATLELLEASPERRLSSEAARRCFGPLARPGVEPVRLLDALRRATLQ